MSKLIKTETTSAIAVPDYLSGITSKQGMDDLAEGSFTIPRLALLQPTSKDVKKNEAKSGVFQNALTKAEYGPSVELVLLKASNGAVYMTMGEGLKCKSNDGKVNVINGGKCSECWLNANYNEWKDGQKPACSQTFDFIAVTRSSLSTDSPETIAVSFMKTSFKMAKDKILSRARALNKPLFAQAYAFGTEYVDNPSGGYYGWTIKYPGWLSADEFARAKQLYDTISSKEYVVQAHEGERDTVASDPLEETDEIKGF